MGSLTHVASHTELAEKILELKRERNAVILAHNYQRAEVQDIADYVGDSLGLSQQAAETGAEVIVFCGVHFMAETAAILCPGKTVLLPDVEAGCPMADMITAEDMRELKNEHPKAVSVCYVNSTAEVKAECDYACTSSNAVKVVNHLKDSPEIIFVPDKYLGDYVSKRTGKELILWRGFCPTHVKIIPEDILKQKEAHPRAKVIVHPECLPEVVALADAALSTGGMIEYARTSEAKEIIVGTEVGILHRMRKENPQKQFYPASKLAVCPNMKRINLEKVFWSLEDMLHRITVPPEIATRARLSIDRMLEIV
jgi:quinolinate synthase